MRKLLTRMKNVNHLFSKIIILYCIAFASFMCIYAVLMMNNTGYDASAILTATLGFFGGELLFMCLKTVFSKTDSKKETASTKDDDDDDEGAVG